MPLTDEERQLFTNSSNITIKREVSGEDLKEITALLVNTPDKLIHITLQLSVELQGNKKSIFEWFETSPNLILLDFQNAKDEFEFRFNNIQALESKSLIAKYMFNIARKGSKKIRYKDVISMVKSIPLNERTKTDNYILILAYASIIEQITKPSAVLILTKEAFESFEHIDINNHDNYRACLNFFVHFTETIKKINTPKQQELLPFLKNFHQRFNNQNTFIQHQEAKENDLLIGKIFAYLAYLFHIFQSKEDLKIALAQAVTYLKPFLHFNNLDGFKIMLIDLLYNEIKECANTFDLSVIEKKIMDATCLIYSLQCEKDKKIFQYDIGLMYNALCHPYSNFYQHFTISASEEPNKNDLTQYQLASLNPSFNDILCILKLCGALIQAQSNAPLRSLSILYDLEMNLIENTNMRKYSLTNPVLGVLLKNRDMITQLKNIIEKIKEDKLALLQHPPSSSPISEMEKQINLLKMENEELTQINKNQSALIKTHEQIIGDLTRRIENLETAIQQQKVSHSSNTNTFSFLNFSRK